MTPKPTISQLQAMHIVQMRTANPPGSIQVSSTKPERLNIFNMPTEPCWYASVPWGDGRDGTMLRSSRAVLVCMNSGRVLYDGSAGDEG